MEQLQPEFNKLFNYVDARNLIYWFNIKAAEKNASNKRVREMPRASYHRGQRHD